MHRIILRPPPERLPEEVERNRAQTPQRDQTHVRHNWRNEAILHDPRRDKFSESVSPDVLVDRDGDHQRSSNGLVGVDRVGRSHGGQGGDLDTGARITDDDDDLPGPFAFVAKGDDEIAEDHDEDVGNWAAYQQELFQGKRVLASNSLIAGRRISGSRTP